MPFQFSELLAYAYSPQDKEFLLQLLFIDGLGRKTAAVLLKTIKKHEVKPQDVWAFFTDFMENKLNNKRIIYKYKKHELEQKTYSINNRFGKEQIRVIAFWEPEYPPALKQTDDFPLLLFVRGNCAVLQADAIAVVGSRKMTAYGEAVTKKLVSELVDAEYTIVSGCMYGVDATAHRAAIDAGGKTIAVLGYGFDYVTPQSTRRLQENIVQSGGCVITEYLPQVPANKGTFPQRNRIVAGISLAVLVTEAALKSGTHITVECALEAGREVFAIPGSIFNPFTQGTKYLLNQGAKLVSSGAEIVAELRKTVTIPTSCTYEEHSELDAALTQLGLDEASKRVVVELFFLPQPIDDLVQKTTLTIQELLTLLGMLELENIVKNEAGIWRCVI